VPLIGDSIQEEFTVCSSKGRALQFAYGLNFLSIQAYRLWMEYPSRGEDDLELLRDGKPPTTPRLRAVSDLARQVVRSKGRLSAEDVRVFLRAGFTQAQLLEILVGISMTAIANYMHNIAKTPIDEVFQIQSWSASA